MNLSPFQPQNPAGCGPGPPKASLRVFMSSQRGSLCARSGVSQTTGTCLMYLCVCPPHTRLRDTLQKGQGHRLGLWGIRSTKKSKRANPRAGSVTSRGLALTQVGQRVSEVPLGPTPQPVLTATNHPVPGPCKPGVGARAPRAGRCQPPCSWAFAHRGLHWVPPPIPVLHILHCGDPFLGTGGKLTPGAAPSSASGWQRAELPVFRVSSHLGPQRRERAHTSCR